MLIHAINIMLESGLPLNNNHGYNWTGKTAYFFFKTPIKCNLWTPADFMLTQQQLKIVSISNHCNWKSSLVITIYDTMINASTIKIDYHSIRFHQNNFYLLNCIPPHFSINYKIQCLSCAPLNPKQIRHTKRGHIKMIWHASRCFITFH